MADKLTDKEIIKALECCISPECENCPYDGDDLLRPCNHNLMKDALDLINRQQAENKELKTENLILSQKRFNIFERIEFTDKLKKSARAEAIKEFWSRLQGIAYQSSDWSHGEHPMVVELDDAEEIYEEMVGEDK